MEDPEILQQGVDNFVKLIPLGFLVGGYGAMVGAGGGFLLVPVLLLLLPEATATSLTSISLTVVFFAAYSGSISYARMGRIDYYNGLLLAAAGIPGIILGRMSVKLIENRTPFELGFGLILFALGLYLALRPPDDSTPATPDNETNGQSGRYWGAIGSAYVAVLSGLLGIGGGFIHVLLMTKLMRMTPHTATATAVFILAILALVGNVADVVTGDFFDGINTTMFLAVGVMMGAPVGAALSQKIRGSSLIRLLALAICIVGGKLIWNAV